jgi:DNA-binding PadR family transcriptional regulator
MREPAYFVLASLLDGPLHGYAIIQRTEQLSGGRVRLATGTLYTALDRLTVDGLWSWCARRSSMAGPAGPTA